jgi:ATP-dependent DNA ligase
VTLPKAPTQAKGLAQNAESLKGAGLAHLSERFVGEPKLDGWRLLVHIAEEGTRIYTRTGKCHTGSLPALERELAEQLPPGTWLDGEAVAMSIEDGRVTHDWGKVQSILGSSTRKAALLSQHITFVAFDLISHAGIDARALPYDKRRKLLVEIFDRTDFEKAMLVPQVEPTDQSLDALLAQGFEGMMVKDRHAPYASGKRGNGWVKVKPQDTLDVVVTGFRPGQNGFSGMVGAITFGQHDEDGDLIEVGRCSGMTMAIRRQMTDYPDAWIGRVIEVKHMGKMPTGGYRHPQFYRIRDDKEAQECQM